MRKKSVRDFGAVNLGHGLQPGAAFTSLTEEHHRVLGLVEGPAFQKRVAKEPPGLGKWWKRSNLTIKNRFGGPCVPVTP